MCVVAGKLHKWVEVIYAPRKQAAHTRTSSRRTFTFLAAKKSTDKQRVRERKEEGASEREAGSWPKFMCLFVVCMCVGAAKCKWS